MCHYGYLNLPIFIHSKEKDDIEDVKTTGILAHNEVRDLVVHAMIEKRQSETDKKKETKRTSSAKKPGKHPTNKWRLCKEKELHGKMVYLQIH